MFEDGQIYCNYESELNVMKMHKNRSKGNVYIRPMLVIVICM